MLPQPRPREPKRRREVACIGLLPLANECYPWDVKLACTSLVLGLLVGCGARTAQVEPHVVFVPAPVVSDGPDAGARPAPPPPVATPTPAAPVMCSATVAVSDIVVPPSCSIDDKLGGRTGTLQYPCDGDGDARLVLNRSDPIAASVQNGALSATVVTEFDWSDGCHWRTFQTVRGAITGKAFVVEYREEPDPASTPCAPPCEGQAQMFVQ